MPLFFWFSNVLEARAEIREIFLLIFLRELKIFWPLIILFPDIDKSSGKPHFLGNVSPYLIISYFNLGKTYQENTVWNFGSEKFDSPPSCKSTKGVLSVQLSNMAAKSSSLLHL